MYVDCQYSEHLPFKWNATRVQLLDHKGESGFHSSYVPQTANLTSRGPVDPRSQGVVQADHRISDPRMAGNNNNHQNASRDPNRPHPQDPRGGFGPSVGGHHDPRSQQQQPPVNSYYSRGPPEQNPNEQAVFVSEYNPQDLLKLAAINANISGLQGQLSNPPPAFQQQPPPAIASTYGHSLETTVNKGYGNSNNNPITYTSTPGSAFVTTQIQPYTPEVVQPKPPVVSNRGGFSAGPPGVQPGFKGASRWEPRDSRNERQKDEMPPRRDQNDRNHRQNDDKRDDRRQRDDRRDNYRRNDAPAVGGRDQFGRDLPPRDSARDRVRDRVPERDRERDRDADRTRSTESPTGSTTSSIHNREPIRPRERITRSHFNPDNLLKYEALK